MKGWISEHLVTRDEHGWSVQTDHLIFHPHSYGIATLLRIGLKINGRKYVLHHFRPHSETEFHDHPWSFRTFVLWGSYVDESLDNNNLVIRETLRAGMTRFRPALHAHRTRCKGHVWTFVVTSKKQRDWCKGSPEKWVCGGEVADFDATRGMVKIR
jgi:hypothetical protein